MPSPAKNRRPRAATASVLLVSALAATITTTLDNAAFGATGNLATNGSFEAGTAGWFVASNLSLSTTDGHTGTTSAHVTNPGAGKATVALNDRVNTVGSTTKGETYTATAWVRSKLVGTSAGVRLMEYKGSTLAGQKKGTVWLTDTAWHQVRTTYTAATSGASLDLNVLAWSLPGSASVDVDDVTLTAAGGTQEIPVTLPVPLPPIPAPVDSPTAAPVTTKPPVTPAPTPPVVVPTPTPPPVVVPAPTPPPVVVPTPTPPPVVVPTPTPPPVVVPTPTPPPVVVPTPTPPPVVVPTPTPPPVVVPTTAPPAPQPAGWRQVWADEFDGSSVDGAKWNVRNNTHNGYERSCLTNRGNNVSVSSGVLHIKAQSENITCGSYTTSWSSGYLDTIGKFSTVYGRYEMRAKMPTQADTSKGLWPAFWLRPNDGGLGELDIMEAVGSGPGEKNYDHVSQTLWYNTDGSVKGQSKAAYPTGGAMSDGYHTYAVEWEPGVIRWYVDGKLTFTRDKSTTTWLGEVFDGGRAFNIRLNLQVGGSWPGLPTSGTQFPADYSVDYVRVFQR